MVVLFEVPVALVSIVLFVVLNVVAVVYVVIVLYAVIVDLDVLKNVKVDNVVANLVPVL